MVSRHGIGIALHSSKGAFRQLGAGGPCAGGRGQGVRRNANEVEIGCLLRHTFVEFAMSNQWLHMVTYGYLIY